MCLGKVAEIIFNPFKVEIDNRKILTKVYQDAVKEIQESEPEQVMQLQSLMERFVIGICEKSEFLLTYEPNPDIVNLLKMYNVHIDASEMDVISKLISYVKLSHRILNTTLFIFVNLKTYFSENTLEKLYQTLCYEKVNVLITERYDCGMVKQEKRIIIDKDACIIYDSER